MSAQLTTNAEALRLFFTEDVYLVKEGRLFADHQHVDLKTEPEVKAVKVQEPKVSAAKEPEPVVPARAITFNYLGKNQRQILILVNDPDHEVSTVQGRELLRKIVKAIDLTANDFALVNYAGHPGMTFTEFSSYFSSKVIFAFGVSPLHIGLTDFPLHSLVVHESVKLVFSSELHQLADDQQGKKILWASLKQLSI